jgi:methylglutamate dehydrogenase subunit D
MLERRSALSHLEPVETPAFRMREDAGFSLTQIATPSKDAVTVLGKLPAHVGVALERDGLTVMRVGPDQFWIIGAGDDQVSAKLKGKAAITPLHSSRARTVLEGTAARDVLARSAALDFHSKAFKPSDFAMTGVHHTPVLVHCITDDSFHVYALRSFAVTVWDWFADAAAGL